jgi:predicted enzyme related to lactoylglutathione lyase
MKAGIDFYREVFGWDIVEDPDMKYGMVSTGRDPGGGIFQAEGEMRPYVTVYIGVDDINATLEKAKELGAFIIQEKKQISEEHGYYGMFADMDNNVIGLWSST